MDLEFQSGPKPKELPLPERAKTSQRLKYEAEIKVFTARYGDLETVRQNLGFSRRRMCQLLLIDPSAWSRWHAGAGRPPAHVYRALEWFLILEGKSELHPKLADMYLKRAPTSPNVDEGLVHDLDQLRHQVRRLRTYLWAAPLASAIVTAIILLIFR